MSLQILQICSKNKKLCHTKCLCFHTLSFSFFGKRCFVFQLLALEFCCLFFATLLRILSRVLSITPLLHIANSLPMSVRAARKMIGKGQGRFQKWVYCPVCSSLYALDEFIVQSRDGTSLSQECTFVQFPNHPQAHRRKVCGTQLMKTVRTSAGTTYLYPRQMYCYKSIVGFLREKMLQPELYECCELWRKRDELEDIFDGEIWNDFMKPSRCSFPFASHTTLLSV